MGSDRGDFLRIRHLDGGSAGNGQCLFLSGEDWLPMAVPPERFWPLGNSEMVVRSVSCRWSLGGSVQPFDPGRLKAMRVSHRRESRKVLSPLRRKATGDS